MTQTQDAAAAPSRAEIQAMLTAPGADFAIVEQKVWGIPMRVYATGPQTLRDVFLETLEYGDRPYLIYADERTTYAENARTVAGLATLLRDEYGLAKGDRLGIAMRNYPEWAPVFFAAQALGLIVVPYNAWWSADELRYAVTDSTPSLIVADRDRAELLAPVCADLGGIPLIEVRGSGGSRDGVRDWEDVLAALDPAATLPDVVIDPDDDATILYTSGTTGRPKGAVGSHRNHCTNLRNIKLSGAIALAGLPLPTTQPGSLCLFPLFHIAGLSTLIAATSNGSKLALMYKWDLALAREHVRTEQLTGVASVPTLAKELVEDATGDPADLASLTSVACGGSPIPPELVDRIGSQFDRRVSPGNGYGLTETTSAVVANSGPEYFAHPDSVGRLQPGADLRIVGPDGEDVAAGEIGELWFRGPNVVRGYWNNPDGTAAAFTDGWFHTGDLGREVDGMVYVVDRLKDVIIRGGENIYSVEVEGALFEHPAVNDVALIGVPDDTYGEVAIAVVVPREGHRPSEDELKEHVGQRLAAFKVPAQIIVQTEPLPRTPTGKALKRQLRSEVLERTEG